MELGEGWNLPLSQAQEDGGEAWINCTHTLASALIPPEGTGHREPQFCPAQAGSWSQIPQLRPGLQQTNHSRRGGDDERSEE